MTDGKVSIVNRSLHRREVGWGRGRKQCLNPFPDRLLVK